MRLIHPFVVSLLVTLLAVPAFAQDAEPIANEEFGVTLTPPANWEVNQGNDKAVANFKHRGSQSQIEVVGTKLMTPDVADVFFKTFHKTLKESNFEQTEQKEGVEIGGYTGTQTTYSFEHSGVTLDVSVFQFLKDSTAWLVIGYMQDTEAEKYTDDFQSVIQNLKFAEGT